MKTAIIILGIIALCFLGFWIDKKCINWQVEEKGQRGMTNEQIIKETNLCKESGLSVSIATYIFGGGVARVNCLPVNTRECDCN